MSKHTPGPNRHQIDGRLMHKPSTDTIISALRILANEIQAPDDMPSTCLQDAADRLLELESDTRFHKVQADQVAADRNAWKVKWRAKCKELSQVLALRDEALAKAERAEALLAKGVAEYDAMFAVGLLDYGEPEWVEGARELIEAAALRGGEDNE